MSEFDFNVLSVKPMVREAASMNNDGGGGNLGYMQQNREGPKDKKHNKFDESIFGKKEEDIFTSEKDFNYVDNQVSFFKLVVDYIKKLLGIK